MKLFRAWLCGTILVLGALASADVPRIFVVQLQEDSETYPDYKSLVLDSYMAAAFDEVGQVDPIVWSMLDQRFRQIADKNGFPISWQKANQSDIVSVSRSVDADYTLVIWAMRSDTIVRPVATLYRGSGFKKIWAYGDWERRMAPFFTGESEPLNEIDFKKFQNTHAIDTREFGAVQVGGQVDWDSTSRTIARTFAHLIRQGPFKDMPATPKQQLPEADPGATVPLPTGVNLPQGGLAEVEELIQKGNIDLAIVQLRDLIDQEPFEDSYRLRLTEILESEKLYVEAAREAARGGQVSKKPLPFYSLAAKNWLRAGILEQALDALNNVLARGGETRETRYMLGQYYLRSGNYEQAIEWYSIAIRGGPTPEIVYERAVAYAFAGQPDACRNDLGSLVDIEADRLEESYMMMVLLCEETLEGIGVRLRDRIPLLRIHKNDQSLITLTVRDQQMAKGLAALMELTPVPKRYVNSHEKRLLAHKLIQQSSTEIFEFATTRREDLATEGTMSLREALRLLPEVRALFEADRMRQAD